MRHAILCGLLALGGRSLDGTTTGRIGVAQKALIDYTLRVDSAGSSEIAVEMRIQGAPSGVLRVAMATHAEYDDRYWRYLSDLRGESARGAVTVAREDSAVWRVTAPPGEVTIRYRVRFPASPPRQQASWMGHLTPTGGLVGGPHSFLYMVGAEQVPVRVKLALPSGWMVATGLEASGAEHRYAAPNAEALIDSPIMVGQFRSWRFSIDGIRHDVAYLGMPGGTPFDTALFFGSVERLSRENVRMFGQPPYHRYQFLFEDGAYGGLEHLNSVSIGAPSASLAADQSGLLRQIAHEFFHTWNEVRIRPTAWIGLRHTPPSPTGELWFSEGVTLYYADLLLRRSGLPSQDSTRLAHLERMIAMYLANPSHASVSPEQTSRAFNRQGVNGDFTPSIFTQGDLLGSALDLMIRDESGGSRSLDDVMRALSARFTPARGFVAGDLERAVAHACACDAHPFFTSYVQSANALDFNRWLGVIGLRYVVTWSPARNADGSLAPDLRLSSYLAPNEHRPRLQVGFPSTVWGRAGLHTGDAVLSWNGDTVDDPQQIRAALGRLHIGDTVRVSVARGSGTVELAIAVTGFDRPTVRIEERAGATEAQRRLREAWRASR
jgi:predicted metalloprotease with PDZ domain